MRIMLEGFGVMTTVPTLRSLDLRRVSGLLDKMSAASSTEDLDLWERQHREFHRVLLTGMSVPMRQLAESLLERTEWARRVRLMRGSRWRGAPTSTASCSSSPGV
ncbi:MAG: FCD domain-containing protein [Nocardioides sp.]